MLCWKARVTTLIVFSHDSQVKPAELLETYDGDGKNLTVRRIITVDREYIADHCKRNGTSLPVIDHDGILDTFNRPIVHYCHQGKWLELPVLQ